MRNDKAASREKKYEIVYKTYVNDIYRICLYYLGDEKQAADVTLQAFVNFYEIFEEVNSEYMLGYLMREVKSLLTVRQSHQFTGEEVKECVMNGKN